MRGQDLDWALVFVPEEVIFIDGDGGSKMGFVPKIANPFKYSMTKTTFSQHT